MWLCLATWRKAGLFHVVFVSRTTEAMMVTSVLLFFFFTVSEDCEASLGSCGSTSHTSRHPPSFAPYLSMQDTADSTILHKRGHLKPFGYHRPPDRLVDALPYMIAPEDFHAHYVAKHRPVVFKGYAKRWKATDLWTDAYLQNNFGDNKMMMETKDDDKENPPSARPIRDFLAAYNDSNLYMVDEVLPAMRAHVDLPTCLRCEEMTDRFFVSYFWMSNGGTSSKLHVDTDENVLCVVHGSKTLLLVSPLQSASLYADESPLFGVSPIDPRRVDFDAFPRAVDVRYELAFVDAGDLVYIPQFWWHHVISHSGRQQAVALWWKSYPLGRQPDSLSPLVLGTENGLFSYVDALVHYERWVLNTSETAPRLKCQTQMKLMSDYKWESDYSDGSSAKFTKEYGYDEDEEKEEESNEFLRDCMFDMNDVRNPCLLRECEEDETDPICVRYMIDYCHEVEDKGCANQLPQVLSRKTQLYLEDIQLAEKRWG